MGNLALAQPSRRSTNYELDVAALRGRTEPRIWTPPLRELTPETSYGYDVIDFARDVLNEPLDPWQEWLVIHAGELLDDGVTPRFSTVLVLVARQNGKTHLLKVLSLYWLFVEQRKMVLGISTNRDYAIEAWDKAVDLAENTPALAALMKKQKNKGVYRGIANTRFITGENCTYRIATKNRKAGRSLTVDRLIIDELREHKDWDAYNAATPTQSAVPDAQAYFLTNQGDDQSVVLDKLREQALTFLDTGAGDDTFGIFEWSAPDGADVMDPDAWAAANPNLGHRVTVRTMRGRAAAAAEAGGEREAGFRTEYLCQRVRTMDAAIDPQDWAACAVPGDLAALKNRMAICLDVSFDEQHATVVAAAMLPDGRVRVEPVASWSGKGAKADLIAELPGLVTKARPRAVGWFPNGPAASVGSAMKARKGWPASVPTEEIRGDLSAACMGMATLVESHRVLHGEYPLLNDHVIGAAKLRRGDVWTFSRKGEGHCDAAYAAAGAIFLAQTMPAPVGKPSVRVFSQ